LNNGTLNKSNKSTTNNGDEETQTVVACSSSNSSKQKEMIGDEYETTDNDNNNNNKNNHISLKKSCKYQKDASKSIANLQFSYSNTNLVNAMPITPNCLLGSFEVAYTLLRFC
jgi:hypothetical protein